MADPVVISTSILTRSPASGTVNLSVTVPDGCNACIIGGTYYNGGSNTITLSGSGWLTVQASENFNDGTGNWMNGYSARCKVTAIGSRTLAFQSSAAFGEGPTCQVTWLTVDDPDDWELDFGRDGQNATPDALSVTVDSETGGLVIAYVGKDANNTLTVPTGYTQQGTTQTQNADSSLVCSANTVGASTTTVTAASRQYPTLFAVSVKAAGGGGAQTLEPPLTTRTRTVYAPTVAAGAVTLQPPLTTRARTIHAPTVAPGLVTLQPPLTTRTRAVYAPVVSQSGGTQTLEPPLTTRTRTVYAPVVVPGAVTLLPPLTTRTRTVYAPTVTTSITISPPLTTRTRTVYSPTVSVGAVTLFPPLTTRNRIIYFPEVTGGDAPVAAGGLFLPIVRRRRR